MADQGGNNYRVLILSQHEVVFTHGDNEYDGRDTFKAMNPFLAFGSLTTDVEHSDEHRQRRALVKSISSVG